MKTYLFIIGILLGSLLTFSVVAHAEGNLGSAVTNLGVSGRQAGTDTTKDVATVVGQVINAALTLVGTIFFILMVYAGYLWLGSRGEEEQITKAKDIIKASIIGLVVVLSAYAITVFVTGRFSTSNPNAPGLCTPVLGSDANPLCPGAGATCAAYSTADTCLASPPSGPATGPGGVRCCDFLNR